MGYHKSTEFNIQQRGWWVMDGFITRVLIGGEANAMHWVTRASKNGRILTLFKNP
jgi:hypothetical protein